MSDRGSPHGVTHDPIPTMALPEADDAHNAHHGSNPSVTDAAPTAPSKTWQRRLSKLDYLDRIKPSRSTNPLAMPRQLEAKSSEKERQQKKWTLSRIRKGIITFGKFIGPGFMVAVAYSKFLHLLDRLHATTQQPWKPAHAFGGASLV